jgi:hypothetical protein
VRLFFFVLGASGADRLTISEEQGMENLIQTARQTRYLTLAANSRHRAELATQMLRPELAAFLARLANGYDTQANSASVLVRCPGRHTKV